jgi:hypothetical protein
MVFQPGNEEAKKKGKSKPFADALRMEIAAAGEDHKALRVIARNLIAQASEPTKDALPAIAQIADRLDGKVPQGLIGGDEDDPAIKMATITRHIIDGKSGNTDSEGVPPAAVPG